MYSHLIIAVVAVAGLTALGFRLLISDYLRKNPLCDRRALNTVIGLPVLQIGLLALAIVPLWFFLPSNPTKSAEAALAFVTSDFGALYYEARLPDIIIEFVYAMQVAYGIMFLFVGVIAAYTIYLIANPQKADFNTIVHNCTAGTTLSAVAVWNYVALFVTIIFYYADIRNEFAQHEGVMIIMAVVLNIAIIAGIVTVAVKIQRWYNKALHSFLSGSPIPGRAQVSTPYNNINISANISLTKQCPYCGETILSVAKKCKHCGEWIKEEDMAMVSPKISCPVCGEEIDASSTVCPVCNESIGGAGHQSPGQPYMAYSHYQGHEVQHFASKPLNTKPIIIGLAGVIIAVLVGVIGYNAYESNKKNELKNAFVERYSSIGTGESVYARYSSNVPGFSEVDKAFNKSIDDLKKYLSEQYDAKDGNEDDIIDTPEYEKLRAICQINANMVGFYRYTGHLMDGSGLGKWRAEKISEILQTRKQVIMNIIENHSAYPSNMSARDNLEYADLYHLRSIGEQLPYGLSLYDVKDHYEWDENVIRYISHL